MLLLSVASMHSFAAQSAPYVGVQLGVNAGGDWRLTNPIGVRTQFGMTGENLGILGGYGALFRERFYLGGEGFFNINAIRTSNKVIDTVGTTVKMRSSYSYGLGAMPGVKITPDTLLYGRIGVVRTQFELSQTPIFSATSKTTNTATGGQLGVGMALSLGKDLDLRGEYVYSQYQSFTACGNKISPYTYQLVASFAYKFV